MCIVYYSIDTIELLPFFYSSYTTAIRYLAMQSVPKTAVSRPELAQSHLATCVGRHCAGQFRSLLTTLPSGHYLIHNTHVVITDEDYSTRLTSFIGRTYSVLS